MNRYPLWKYITLAVVLIIALIYALPNLYGEDPAVQLSPAIAKNQLVTDFKKANIAYKSIESQSENSILIRFNDTTQQIRAQDFLKNTLGEKYTVALNLAPATPTWLQAIGAKPMNLGLDLRGGVHFLMEIDIQSILDRRLESVLSDVRTQLRENNIRYISAISARIANNNIHLSFATSEQAHYAYNLIKKQRDIQEGVEFKLDNTDSKELKIYLSSNLEQQLRNATVEQTLVTLRNRVNELGVAEAVVQRQGLNHIVVELPGIQDTARAKDILGKTATLAFLMHDDEHALEEALTGQEPPGSKIYYDPSGHAILLKKRVILSGDAISNAMVSAAENGMPAVSVRASGGGLAIFKKVTRENIGKQMAVVFIETKMDDHTKKVRTKETVVSVARINSALGSNFQITGLNAAQAQDLSLYLRAGALPATISIVEERTVGPSLGQENIELGMMSIAMGLSMVLIVMLLYYSVFGLIADIALCLNVILLVAVLSLIGATLTLPGIAGIVLTVGMAVDANILIFERIREELRNGMSAQSAIHSGFERAFSTIFDSNITTLIVGLVLFSIGSGPVRGFAVTLSIGILTSMFTAVTITRAMVNLVYGGYRGRVPQKIRVGI